MSSRTLWLHFGIQKTGSSSFQFLLREHQEKLVESGIFYLDPYFCLSPNPWYAENITSRAFFEDKNFNQLWFDRSRLLSFRDHLLASIPASAKHLILSNENFYPVVNSSARKRFSIKALKQFARDLKSDVRIVVYLRRQDEHLISYYQERVKASFRLNNASREFLSLPVNIDDYANVVTQTNYYDYFGQISLLSEHFHVDVKLMEDEINRYGLMASLCQSFQLPDFFSKLKASKNVSLEAHATVALRRFLDYGHQENLPQAKLLKGKNYLFKHYSSGRKLDLLLSTKEVIMKRHQQANRVFLESQGCSTSAWLEPVKQTGLTVNQLDLEHVESLYQSVLNFVG